MIHSPESVEKFIKLVAGLRVKQRAYFSDRSQVSLVMAKAAERQVDGWLSHFIEMEQLDKEPELLQAALIKESGKMKFSNPVTSYCEECDRSPGDCRCEGSPPLICGTCQKPTNSCQCDPDYLLKRCSYCAEFTAIQQHPAVGEYVCQKCLANKAVQFQLEHHDQP
jgi:hypothetical protein